FRAANGAVLRYLERTGRIVPLELRRRIDLDPAESVPRLRSGGRLLRRPDRHGLRRLEHEARARSRDRLRTRQRQARPPALARARPAVTRAASRAARRTQAARRPRSPAGWQT